MIDAPASEPAAARLLLLPKVLEAASDGRKHPVIAQRAQRLEDMAGHVRAGWIEGLTKIAERNRCQQLAVVVAVERSPAAGMRLHGQHPFARAADGRVDLSRIIENIAQARENDQRHRGVVQVRIMQIGALERPAARCDALDLHRPVARRADFLCQQPVNGPLHRLRIPVFNTAVQHREQRQ